MSLSEPAVADGPDLGQLHADLLAAALRHGVLGAHDDNPLSGVDRLVDLQPNALELREQVLVVAPDGIPASINAGRGRVRVGVELDLGVKAGLRGLEIVAGDGRIELATFSCDIVYSDSPAASRAFAWLVKL